MPNVYIRTFGCQMNEQDSEIMKGLLRSEGYRSVDRPEKADLILVNTCSIREKAYQKAVSEIGRRREWRKAHGGALLGVVGCVASQEGDRILKRFREVDFVLGPDQIGKLPEQVKRARDRGERTSEVDFQDISDYEFPTPIDFGSERRIKASVTIMKGCDNACSFCIVPLTRGKEVSRPLEDILGEIGRLEREGVREVLLLGQNVNSYGKRFSPRTTFADLLKRIDEETTLARVRFTSPHPKDLSKELIAEYGRNEKLCPHIHLPVQSGSNRVLKKMRRSYTRETYLRKVEALRRVRPDMGITTDLIVGFPGETEADFEETLKLMAEVEFDQSYSFVFSPRPGTEATHFEDLPLSVKEDRLQALQALQRNLSLKRNSTRVGCVESVLVEGPSVEGPSLEGVGQMTGRTPHGRIVNFNGGEGQTGAILPIKIQEVSPCALRGEVDAH